MFLCGSDASSLMIASLNVFFQLGRFIGENCNDGNDLNLNYRSREIEIYSYFQLSQLGIVLRIMGVVTSPMIDDMKL